MRMKKTSAAGGNQALNVRRGGEPDDSRTDAIFGIRNSMRLAEIDLSRIHPRSTQPRRHFDQLELENLADSMKRNRLLQPILVQDDGAGGYSLIAGERRWRAAAMLGWQTINAVLCDSNVDPDEVALAENIQRANLTPLEEAHGTHRLMQKHGWTQEEAAGALGKSRAHITALIRLVTLPAYIQEELLALERTGGTSSGVSAGVLAEIALAGDLPDLQRELWELAKQDRLTVAEARRRRETAGAVAARSSRARNIGSTRKVADRLAADLIRFREEGVRLADEDRRALEELRARIDDLLQ